MSSIERQRFATRVLYATTLEGKRLGPESGGESLRPKLIAHPGRPNSWTQTTGREKTHRAATIRDERNIGAVLHTFANHELLAVDLLAWALLRFPDAPESLARGWLQTLVDEQLHMRLYEGRMAACGVEFGELPSSFHFWNALHTCSSPAEFMAGLSLTLEQANLDFSLYWQDAFRLVDDKKTVSVLKRVYEDEIRHVALGVTWLTRWAGQQPPHEYWKTVLPSSLSVARARGPGFDVQGRVAAKMSADWIEMVQVSGGSRGRRPTIYSFHPGLEEELATGSVSKMARKLKEQWATVVWPLAKKDDVIWASPPPVQFVRRWQALGISLGEFRTTVQEYDAGHEPWGLSPANAEVPGFENGFRSDFLPLHSKVEYAKRFGGAEICRSVEEVEEATGALFSWIVKAALSAAGGRRIVGRGGLTQANKVWVERALVHGGELRVEPQHRRVRDLSVQVQVGKSKVKILGIFQQFCTDSGVFRGVSLENWQRDLPTEVRRFLHQGGAQPGWAQQHLNELGQRAGAFAQSVGYVGPLSVDTAIVVNDDGFFIHPGFEMNVRYTFGRVALELFRRRAVGRPSWCFFVSKRLAKDCELTLVELIDELQGLANTHAELEIAAVVPCQKNMVVVPVWFEAKSRRALLNALGELQRRAPNLAPLVRWFEGSLAP